MSVRFLLSLVATLGLATANVATANVCISDAQARNYLQQACADGVNNGACAALLQDCECVACASDGDCGSGEYCDSGACSTYECASHGDCNPFGKFFCAQWGRVDGTMVYGEEENDVMCRPCGECHAFAYAIDDGSCPEVCGPAPSCNSHDDCTEYVDGVSQYCHRGDQGVGTCRAAPLCLILNDAINDGSCPTCASDSDCNGGNIEDGKIGICGTIGISDGEKNVCLLVECTSHEHCASDQYCFAGFCDSCGLCSELNDGIDGCCPDCGDIVGVCNGCTSNEHCAVGLSCNADTGQCVSGETRRLSELATPKHKHKHKPKHKPKHKRWSSKHKSWHF